MDDNCKLSYSNGEEKKRKDETLICYEQLFYNTIREEKSHSHITKIKVKK